MKTNVEDLRDRIDKDITNEIILKSIKKIDTVWVDKYYKLNYGKSLKEMSKINTKDTKLFPYNKFDIIAFSNEKYDILHLHVICECWDIVVSIENGEILRIKNMGKPPIAYAYVRNNIKKWLDTKHKDAEDNNMTNRAVSLMVWDMNN